MREDVNGGFGARLRRPGEAPGPCSGASIIRLIYEVLVRYCRGVDRCDEDLIRSTFHSDSYDDHGYWKGPGHELATFLADRLRNANSATTHSITNLLIELDGDLAVSESQVHATLIRRGAGPVHVDVVGARYLDRFSRRANTWRIEHRTVVLDWRKTEVWPESAPQVPIDGFARGARSPEDPSYAVGVSLVRK